ncbi:DUF2953 domain-containing protein [Thermoflavimicrobium daqui]|uniref:DUF2953 domain-containing protein n=1 Tax=Thermoflavimicrobium daqui TaxID=2137476 RepID=A0A364K2Z6_9BACL|nr:DUF2953 domain-containing protein [Thermoflavimicrobium daqui]RAL22679.1 hypothetical protein DL897_13505 [Thermoflavimicrobium daqui]
MNFFIWIGIILLVFLLIIPFTSIRIEVLYQRTKENDQGRVEVRALFGLIRFQLKLPKLDFKGLDQGIHMKSKANIITKTRMEDKIGPKSIQFFKEKYQELLDHFTDFIEVTNWFLSKVTCEKWIWHTKVGTGDAAEAGILTGMIWGVKSTLVGFISHYIQWQTYPLLNVQPAFHQAMFDIYFHSIIRFRIGHAILAMKRLVWDQFVRRDKKWQSIQSKA